MQSNYNTANLKLREKFSTRMDFDNYQYANEI